jgi:hypothetical protein
VQFLGRLQFESEKRCGVIVNRSAGGGVEFPDPDLSFFRNSTLSIAGDGYTSNCGVKSRWYLTYSWSLFENNAAVAVSSASLRSVSVNPLEFKLPSYRLSVGSLCRVQLVVKHSISLRMSFFVGGGVCAVR